MRYKEDKKQMNKLFSYGTLLLKQVQLDTFGRLLDGKKDRLPRYRLRYIKITDPDVIKSSGTDTHPILEFTGKPEDFVEGTVYEITDSELERADSYEVDDYRRELLEFESGIKAFVYVKA